MESSAVCFGSFRITRMGGRAADTLGLKSTTSISSVESKREGKERG